MTKSLKILISQLNFTVGDLKLNKEKILNSYKNNCDKDIDLIVFSELSIIGYPPEDLILRKDFQDKSIDTINDIAKHIKGNTAILIGGLWRAEDKIYNAAFLIENQKITNIIYKHDLPNYGVFDEKRIFSAGELPSPVNFRGSRLGVMVCEDLWGMEVSRHLKNQGAEILISINASPYEHGKHVVRINIARKNVEQTGLPLVYVNQVGGQDELLFSGGSFVMSGSGKLCQILPRWQEAEEKVSIKEKEIYSDEEKYESIYHALQLGLRDYVEKNKFPGVIVGFSGGIDSAATAAIAVDALGKEKVRLVMMPSEYTSKESLDDAEKCAKLLGVELSVIPINDAVLTFSNMLAGEFKGKKSDTTEENIQSRIRAVILMAISNKFGHMVLTTGNKSEMAVGYATLYGDMCGGFNVLKDLYKTEVFELCKWRNKQSKVIPQNIIKKPPTAELRHNQKDEDSLPPYEILDKILYCIIEKRQSSAEIIDAGFDKNTVKKVARLVKIAEYKRRQSPPGVKITGLSFGKDRRYPITHNYDF